MAEVGISLDGHTSKHVDSFKGEVFGLIITVCNNAKESCPFFPGKVRPDVVPSCTVMCDTVLRRACDWCCPPECAVCCGECAKIRAPTAHDAPHPTHPPGNLSRFGTQSERHHWPFDDPADAEGTQAEKMAVFRRVRDEIRAKITAYLTGTVKSRGGGGGWRWGQEQRVSEEK